LPFVLFFVVSAQFQVGLTSLDRNLCAYNEEASPMYGAILLALSLFAAPRHSLVHFVVINMSGTAREVHHRGEVVSLPIAARIALQVPAGDSIEVVSAMDTKVREVITIEAKDEGQTLPIR
jgi:hypothetical protein